MRQQTLRVLFVVSTLNALLTLAYPAALASLLFVEEFASALRVVALVSVVLAALGCLTILGLRRYLAVECDFQGASGPLAVHAAISAGSGFAILVGWGVLRLGSTDSELSWVLGLTVLGFFLVVGIVIGLLELLAGRALGRAKAEGYGLLAPIRTTFLIAGAANLVSVVLGFTMIAGMAAYAANSVLFALLFFTAWRDRAGRLPEGYRYRKRWLAAVIAVAVFSVLVPGAAAVYQLRAVVQGKEAAAP